MHVSTETTHPQHTCEVDGVGLTDTAHDIVEALCRLPRHDGSTSDVVDEAHLRDRQEAHRSLRRLENAGVVEGREADVELKGTARKPRRWTLTDVALDVGIVERLRTGSDVPLDPVREREQRIDELEDSVTELRTEIEHLRDEVTGYRANSSEPSAGAGWDDIDPVD